MCNANNQILKHSLIAVRAASFFMHMKSLARAFIKCADSRRRHTTDINVCVHFAFTFHIAYTRPAVQAPPNRILCVYCAHYAPETHLFAAGKENFLCEPYTYIVGSTLFTNVFSLLRCYTIATC